MGKKVNKSEVSVEHQIAKRLLYNLIIIVVLFSIGTRVVAQTVKYSYKPLAAEGCTMKYNVVKQDTAYYIIATVRSGRMNFLNESTMKIRTFDDDVITLKGMVISNGSQSAGLVTGNIILPITEISSTAQFAITPESSTKRGKICR